MPAEIELITCGYPARCAVRPCTARATVIVRYTDDQGRALRERELCDRHTAWLKQNRQHVNDLRGGEEA